uniref:Aminopeptidase n=2 Tax=Nyssomyia neivai TaxID=330878 RepID=A0A1L8E232_9DIPT
MRVHILIHILTISGVFCKFHLPTTSHPYHYALYLDIDVDGGVYNGTVEINLNVTQATDRISLNYKDLSIHTNTVRLRTELHNYPYYPLRHTEYDESAEIVEFIFDELEPDAYLISIPFNGTIRNDLKGLYMSYYWTDDGEKHLVATTFLAPIYARMLFPCYDEPHYKATFSVSLLHSNKYQALSNMPTITVPQLILPDLLLTNFRTTPKMSTYLLAITVSDFFGNANYEENYTVYSQPAQIYMTNYALKFGQQSLERLEEYFGAPYQLSKLDLVAFDDFLMGAMENWGLITFISSSLLYDETSVPTKNLQALSRTITHELAHQWFGNEVTARWWSEIWLNEGFATLFADLITNELHPDWQLMDQFVVHTLQHAMDRDAAFTTKAMDGPIETLQDIWSVYSYLPYQKAASVIRMILNVVTDAAFQKAIRNYVKRISYSSAVPQDLYDQLVAQTNGDEIEKIFKSWVENPGFPLVTIKRMYNTSSFVVSQKRFIASQSKAVPDTKYYIPLNFATTRNPDFLNTKPDFFMTPEQTNMTVTMNGLNRIEPRDWVVANKRVTYYYRVNYDEENWHLITQALRDDPTVIAVANRAQLIDDAFTLAKYGQVPYNIPLDLVTYIRNETHYLPITVAIKHLTELDRIIRGTSIPLRDFMKKIFADIYNRITLKENKYDAHLLKLLRSEVSKFACNLEVEECIADASDQISANDISPDTRPAIFCGHLRGTKLTTWPIPLLNTKLSNIVESERMRRKYSLELQDICQSFSCVTSQTLRLSVLEMTMVDGNNLLSSDYNSILSAIVLSGKESVTDILEFLNKYSNRIDAKYSSLGRTIQILGEQVKTDMELELLKKFVNEKIYGLHNVTPEMQKIVLTAIEKGEENIVWLNTYSSSIDDWIKQHNSASNLMKSFVVVIVPLLTIMCNKIQSGY